MMALLKTKVKTEIEKLIGGEFQGIVFKRRLDTGKGCWEICCNCPMNNEGQISCMDKLQLSASRMLSYRVS